MCMVEGEDNPELIEKILVMHGKQQQKQQEDLDDAAVYRICGDIRMKKDGLMFAKKLMLSTGK